MRDSDSPKSSPKSGTASAASSNRSGEPSQTPDEFDVAFGGFGESDDKPRDRNGVDAVKKEPARASDAGPPPSKEVQATSSPEPIPRSATAEPSPRRKSERPPASRGVELSSDEQRKLEDIRRKLKDIFVTAEKNAPAQDTIKPEQQQTVSSGLLDLRQLAKDHLGVKEQARTDVDDDMVHLSGGLFGGARNTGPLGAPDLSRPAAPPPKPPPPARATQPPAVQEEVVELEAEPEPKRTFRERMLSKPALTPTPVMSDPDDIIMPKPGLSGRAMVALTIGGMLLFGGVFFAVMRGGGEDTTDKPTAEATDVAANTGAATEQGQRTGAPGAVVQPPSQADATQPTAVSPGSPDSKDSTSKEKEKDKKAKSDAAGSSKSAGSKPDGQDDAPSKPEKPSASPGKEATPATPPPTATAEKPAAPPPSAAAEFDAGAARAALNAAASRAMSCKGDGPSGTASVSVTFAPSGRVTSARVDGGPFSGTPAGGCIATAFRSATVPRFDGSSITVRKTVSIR